MGDYKTKKIKSKKSNYEKSIINNNDPNKYYSDNPSQAFSSIDAKMWTISKKNIGDIIWDEIFPKLKNLETQTWEEILIKGKKLNHSINIKSLNKKAVDRLAEKYIELDSIISLRLTGKHRLYGYIQKSTFYVLWYDDNHGDNNECVCRSNLKHT